MNPVQVARGIEKTSKALVSELKLMSREVNKFLFFFFLSSFLEVRMTKILEIYIRRYVT